MSEGDAWRADVGMGGLRPILLRGALVGCFLLVLIALVFSGSPKTTSLALASGAVTLAVGVVATGLAELAARRGGWTVHRGSDLVVVTSTLGAACATAQFAYAEAAIEGGPHAGYEALTTVAAPELVAGVLVGSFVLWGVPCGLMTYESVELRDIWRLRPELAVISVVTCFGGAVAVVLLTASYHLTARLEARLAAAHMRGST